MPTYRECIEKCGSIENAVNIFEDKIPGGSPEVILDKEILPLDSDPTSEDTDDDGLLDGISQYNNDDQKVAPKDPDPLNYNGPKNLWKNHISAMSRNVPDSLGGLSTFDLCSKEYESWADSENLIDYLDGLFSRQADNLFKIIDLIKEGELFIAIDDSNPLGQHRTTCQRSEKVI